MQKTNYQIQTATGDTVYSSGRSLSIAKSAEHWRPYTTTDASPKLIAYWSKKVGVPVVAIECGKVECFDL